MRLGRRLGAAAACAVALLAAAPAEAARPSTPETRLLNVWLDLRLLAIFYPDTTPATFQANLRKVARQLNQDLPPVRVGNGPRDTFRLPPRTVVISRNAPPETWILYTRSGRQVWRLLDDREGRLSVGRIPTP